MKTNILKKLSIFLIAICTSCVYEPKPDVLNVYNNSDATIFILSSCDKNLNLEQSVKLFDTVYSEVEKRYNVISPLNKFYPYSIYQGGILREDWKSYIDGCIDKKVKFYVIDAKVVENEPWSKIIKQEIYLKKMEYTHVQLDSLNWLIEYKAK